MRGPLASAHFPEGATVFIGLQGVSSASKETVPVRVQAIAVLGKGQKISFAGCNDTMLVNEMVGEQPGEHHVVIGEGLVFSVQAMKAFNQSRHSLGVEWCGSR